MSQVIDLCEGSDGNGEWPNAASAPPPPLSRKRRRDDKEESSNDAHPLNENGPGNKTATGWAKFVFDLELADEVEVPPHRKRRCVMKGDRSAKNDETGKIGQTQKRVQATEKNVGSEDAQAVDHDESHEGFAAAASHPMNLDSEQTSRDEGCANKHPQSRSTSKGTTWEDRLSELADYQKVHGHCNVPQRYSENAKLGKWVAYQRRRYSLHQRGKAPPITLPRIKALERLGFEWSSPGATCIWEHRLSELAGYRKVHGHCNVPQKYSENAKLGEWVAHQRSQYWLHQEGKTSPITLPRIQALERLGLEWGVCVAWEDRLSELADYRKLHGHCNVTIKNSQNAKLAAWVATQRSQYSLHLKGETSRITLPRIQALESLCFEWYRGGTVTCPWEDRLSELADYRKVHGHCNVPGRYSDNTHLGFWVATQRSQNRLRLEGKTSSISLPRFQALERLGFEWSLRGATCPWEDRLSELADYRKLNGHCNVTKKNSQNAKLAAWVATQRSQYSLHLKGETSRITLPRIQALESLCFEWYRGGTVRGGTVTCPWEDRLSELVDYRKVHGHCNVPQHYNENAKLGTWVTNQRRQYSLHLKGKTSPITLLRIQALERLGFEWSGFVGWEVRLSELADYRKVHGHCNVLEKYCENAKLVAWVAYQRHQYRLHLEGKTSPLTLPRIQALERLGFEW